MSLGRVIQDMHESLERLKAINQTAPPPMFEQAAMEWALGELKDRFPDKYVTVKCEKGIYSSGDQNQECTVYVADLGHFRDKTFSMALKKLVDAHAAKLNPPEPDPEDVPTNATEDAVAKAEAAKVYEETHPIGWGHV